MLKVYILRVFPVKKILWNVCYATFGGGDVLVIKSVDVFTHWKIFDSSRMFVKELQE